jgi:hypothetical protein
MSTPELERLWNYYCSRGIPELGNADRAEMVRLWDAVSHEERLELHIRYYAKFGKVLPPKWRSNKCVADRFKHHLGRSA